MLLVFLFGFALGTIVMPAFMMPFVRLPKRRARMDLTSHVISSIVFLIVLGAIIGGLVVSQVNSW